MFEVELSFLFKIGITMLALDDENIIIQVS